MKSKLYIAAALLMHGLALQAQPDISRCPASPEPLTIRQPDGSTLTIQGRGDILLNYTETTDGYVVMPNNKGIYEYAIPDGRGGLIPGGRAAHNPAVRSKTETATLKTIQPHLRLSEAAAAEKLNPQSGARMKQLPEKPDHKDKQGIYGFGSFPTDGKRNVLLLLVKYPDLDSRYTESNFDSLMNQAGYKGTGSFRDFYLANSFGKLDLNTDVFGWYTADSNYAFYGNNTTGDNPGQARTRILISKAIEDAENAGVDFSKYDNDGDGEVDGVMVIHAGPGAEEGSQNQYIWSHRWVLGNDFKKSYDGVNINSYVILPETRGGSSPRMVGIGVICHEFGHLLGLPDFYDVLGKSEGLGNWCLMAAGNWLGSEASPASMSAFSKMEMGWVTPVEITKSGFYSLRPAATDSQIYRISTPVSHEYYLLENKQPIGFDTKLNGKGLTIWRVDDSVYNAGMWMNMVNTNPKHKGVDLVQADGKFDLDTTVASKPNRGDAGDLFPGSTNATAYDDDTKPSAKNYNGNRSNIRIFGIKELTDSTVSFGFGSLPQAKFTAGILNICPGGSIPFTNKSRYADSYAWDFGDGETDTVVNPVHKYTQSGTFRVKLLAISGIDSTADSLTIKVNQKAVADFDVTPDSLSITVRNRSTGAKGYIWYWGDTKTSINSQDSFTRTYAKFGTYTIKLIALSKEGSCHDTIEKTVTLINTGIADASGAITGLGLYPNPAGQKTTLNFSLSQQAQVEVFAFNALGQKTAALQSVRTMQAGAHTLNLELGNTGLNTGVHFICLRVNQTPYYIPLIKN